MKKISFFKISVASCMGLGLSFSATAIPIGSAMVGGLLQFDAVGFTGDKEDVARSSADVRRANIWIKGDLPKQWSYQLGYDARYTQLDTSWIGYNGFDYFWLAIGYIDVPQSLDYWSSYTYSTFMESASPVTAMKPHKALGLYADGLAFNNIFSYQTSLYGSNIYTEQEVQIRTRDSAFGSDSDKWGIAGRGVVHPKLPVLDVFHLGASARVEGISDTDVLNPLITTPGLLGRSSGAADNILVSSMAPLPGAVSDVVAWGAEYANLWGPLTGQAEYLGTHWAPRDGGHSLNFWGWYAQVAYLITGEQRAYDEYNGTIGNVEGINSDYGAWELALRYSYTDLDSYSASTDFVDLSQRGNQWDWTAGINWYIIENVKIQGNFTYAHANYKADYMSDADVKAIGLRAQVDF